MLFYNVESLHDRVDFLRNSLLSTSQNVYFADAHQMVICLFMAIWCNNASIFDLKPHPHDRLKTYTKVYCLQCAQLLVLLTFPSCQCVFLALRVAHRDCQYP